MESFNLEGKHILVTGATSGIGRETAIILSKIGARVVIVGRREEKMREVLSLMKGDGHSAYSIDVADIDNLESKLKCVAEETGVFDGFAHCAGIVKNLPVANFKHERLHEIMLTNFYSYYEIVRVLCKKRYYNNELSIVGVSSVAANAGEIAQSAYGASKAAMNGAMRCFAKELAAKNIRVNNVLPAATDTDMYRSYMALKTEIQGSEMESPVNPRQYLGINNPSDVAYAIIYLLSPLSRKITGIELPVDGGYTSC